MDLYLIRHAHAADGGFYGDDYERPLTSDGRRAAQSVGDALVAQKVTFAAIVSSPLVRAVETAELLAVKTGFDGGLHIARALAPDGDTADILREAIAPYAQLPSLALVGHQPSMGQLTGALLGRASATLAKGAVVRVTYEVDERRGKLAWVITPKRLAPTSSFD